MCRGLNELAGLRSDTEKSTSIRLLCTTKAIESRIEMNAGAGRALKRSYRGVREVIHDSNNRQIARILALLLSAGT